MSETDELARKLKHREAVNAGEAKPQFVNAPKNVYTEFEEFTRKQIKEYESIFKKYDEDKNNFIDQHELQLMMEKLGAPQTFLGLKQMIKTVDEDNDGVISFREFLLIFRKAALGELEAGSGLSQLAQLTEIDVDKAGVGGAAQFFEAKAAAVSAGSKFEQEIRAEQEERKREAEQKKVRKQEFKAKAQAFQSQ